MKSRRITSKTAVETKTIAGEFSKKILKEKNDNDGAIIIGLIGELGSGKTTFAKGFAKGLGIRQIIQSPTFIIARRHDIKYKNYRNFYHIDAYRVSAKDFKTIGWKNWIKNPQNIILVEWADRISKIMPKESTKIRFEVLKNGQRKITIR